MTTATTTTTTTYPDQLRLPGQAAAPDGPVDLAIMYVLHHAFRRDLTSFAEAVPVTPVGSVDTWLAMRRRWDQFALVLHQHHGGEDDGLWPALLARADAAGDADGRRTLEAMEAEHSTIDPALAACADGLALMAHAGTEDHRAALAVHVASTRDALSRHLAHEETEAMALVQRYLTPQDWLEIDEEYFARRMPPEELLFVAPWALKGLPAGARGRALGLVGAKFRVLDVLTRGSFTRLDRAAFSCR